MVKAKLTKFFNLPYVAGIISVLGGLIYFVQAYQYAHMETSMVDEGGYLYIGYLYVKGILRPFQDFGIPRWYAPLSYLIPGQIEKWFGPSLLTGRYFSIAVSLLMLLALWLTARRLGNRWWGAAIVWSCALSPIVIQIYSLAAADVLVACMIAWSLMLVLGENRKLWQIVTGSILAGLIIMTRQSLIALPVLLVVYIFWQNGKKVGLWALGGVFLPIVIFHVLFWPNILELWAVWLPARLTPFLDAYRFPAINFTSPASYSLATVLSVFFLGFRFNFFAMVGCLTVLFLWPNKGEWKSPSSKRIALFLVVSFLILNTMHFLAAFSTSAYVPGCTFCYITYVTYYNVISLILIVVSASSWKRKTTTPGLVFSIICVMVLTAGLGYANTEGFGDWLLKLHIPAVSRGMNPVKWFPLTTIGVILSDKYHLGFGPSRIIAAVVAGLVIGILVIVLSGIILAVCNKQRVAHYSFGIIIFIILLGSGYILSPLMGGEFREDGLCQGDSLLAYKQVGNDLARMIPAGSNVYWDVSYDVPLLYVPSVNIHPAQLYSVFSFRVGGDNGQLNKQGFWNEALAIQWASEADFIVIMPGGQTYKQLGDHLDLTQFDKFQTASVNPCNADLYLIVYQRKPK